MRVLGLHSYYREVGGEDLSFEQEIAILRGAGHEVRTFTASAAELGDARPLSQARKTIWNRQMAEKVGSSIAAFTPDVAYINNIFPALSASVLDVIRAERIPAVVAVRNYRLWCVSGLAFREGVTCRTCLERQSRWSGLMHSCYHGSSAQSLVVARAMAHLWKAIREGESFTVLAAVSEHVAQYLRTVGVPDSRIVIKPNALFPEPEVGVGSEGDVVLAGRLEPEKGAEVAIRAYLDSNLGSGTLTIVGAGSLLPELRRKYAGRQVRFSGLVPHQEVLRSLRGARVALVPSLWDEPFGRVAIESMAVGTPVIVSDRGGLREIPESGKSGLVASAGDVTSWVAAIREVTLNPYWRVSGRSQARARFRSRFSEEAVSVSLTSALEYAVNLAGR